MTSLWQSLWCHVLSCPDGIFVSAGDYRYAGRGSLTFLAGRAGTASLTYQNFGTPAQGARDSYRLDKCMYEPLNISLASSFNCIHAYQKEIKLIEQAIEKCINGMNPNALLILQSIPGIGPIWASGILSEIGDITVFHSSDALAKYAGLYWPKGDSGDFTRQQNVESRKSLSSLLSWRSGKQRQEAHP